MFSRVSRPVLQQLHRRSTNVVRRFAVPAAAPSPEVSIAIDPSGRGIEVRLPEEKSVFLHSCWLMEKTRDPNRVQLESGERLFDSAEYVSSPSGIKEEGKIRNIFLDHRDNEEVLVLQYKNGLEDILSTECLLNELENKYIQATYSPGSSKAAPVSLSMPTKRYWGSDDLPAFTIDKATHHYDEVMSSEMALKAFLEDLFVYGTAVVKGTPTDKEEYAKFLHTFGFLRESNWGEWFMVMSKEKPKTEEDTSSVASVANTNLEVPFHTDGPYNRNPLQHQVLQCIKQSPIGGESQLSDAFGAAIALKEDHPEYFDILAKTKVFFRYTDANLDVFSERSMLQTDEKGNLENIFFSNRVDISPIFENLDEANKFYYAKQLWREYFYDPKRVATFKLEENDMLIFDNMRLLHGRTAFDEVDTGADDQECVKAEGSESAPAVVDGMELSTLSRYLRGCYLDSIDIRLRRFNRLSSQPSTSKIGRATVSVGSPLADINGAGSQKRAFSTSSFIRLDECTEDDMKLVSDLYSNATTGEKLADRSFALLKMLCSVSPDHHFPVEDTNLGIQVDLFEHGLQTATRAFKNGEDEEVVIAGLFHDLGELLSPSNHGEFAASLLRPFVSPKVSWMLEHHEVFQMYYYNHKMSPPGDRNLREMYKGPLKDGCTSNGIQIPESSYDFTVDFCERYDQTSFDPNYSSMELKEFEAMAVRVFSRKPYWHTPNHPKKGAVTRS
mmetsp:Transcript_1226/g.1773  ORF Transcript_1226/g.1773 Transcript_1226/m.1773 type:complete len:726 (+) Transcript_1226:451-2628(+)